MLTTQLKPGQTTMAQTTTEFLDEDTPLPLPLPGLGLLDQASEPVSAEVISRILALAQCVGYKIGGETALPGLTRTIEGTIPRNEAQGTKIIVPPEQETTTELPNEQQPEQILTSNSELKTEEGVPEQEISLERSLPAAEAVSPKRSKRPSSSVYYALLALCVVIGFSNFTLSWLTAKETRTIITSASSQVSMSRSAEEPSEVLLPNISLVVEALQCTQTPKEDQGKKQRKETTYTYRLGKYDYPSLLAYACGKKGKKGFEAYQWITTHNPQVDWEKTKLFHEGETYEAPCELTPKMLRNARHELRKLRNTTQGESG